MVIVSLVGGCGAVGSLAFPALVSLIMVTGDAGVMKGHKYWQL